MQYSYTVLFWVLISVDGSEILHQLIGTVVYPIIYVVFFFYILSVVGLGISEPSTVSPDVSTLKVEVTEPKKPQPAGLYTLGLGCPPPPLPVMVTTIHHHNY